MNPETPEQPQLECTREMYDEIMARSPIHARGGSTDGLPHNYSRSIHSSSLLIDQRGTQVSPGPRPTPEQLIATENELARLWNAGEINSLLHLAGSVDGEYEKWLCQFFESNIAPTDWVLASHRAHFHYQLHGGTDLIEKVKAGKSMFCYSPFFIQSAIVAGTASIAVGLALVAQKRGSDQKVFCFVGDGAADHGHLLEAIAFTASKRLPLHFVLEDNNGSCGVTKDQRRGDGFEWHWPACVTHYRYELKWPHAGTSQKITLKKPRR